MRFSTAFLALTLALVAAGSAAPTLQPLVLSQSACRPGYGITANFRWDAQPAGADYKVFVHVVNASWAMAFQADHDLPVPTSQWSGRIAYDVLLSVPPDLAAGTYTVYTGLFNPVTGAKLPLTAGPGVTDVGGYYYRVASFDVSPTAPLPKLPPPTLDLTNYHVTFSEDFTGPLSVSARGPGTRWISHMPDFADFGDGKFADPGLNTPFAVSDGMLKIKASKLLGAWQSGLLASVDSKGRGFSQQYGYFEMQAKLPKGEGVWPAFWLMKPPTQSDKSITRIEIDVLEQYGARPNALNSTVHFWGPVAAHRSFSTGVSVTGMTDDFHRYGVLVAEDFITFYFDGSEYWKMPTPPEAKVPLYLLVDLALGGGWPTAKTPEPSTLVVDYIRAYAKD